MATKMIPHSLHSITALAALSFVVLIKLFIVNAYEELSTPTIPKFELMYFLTTSLVCGSWMYTERRRNGESLISLAPTLAAIFWPIGMPLYIVHTRKWFGVAKVIVALICLAAFAILGAYIGRLSLNS